MSCLKSSFALLILLPGLALAQSAPAQKSVEKFSPSECLAADFETTVSHKGGLFGFMEKELVVSKKQCEITVADKGVLETSWNVDVCREPIHMKVTSKGSLKVHKRAQECKSSAQSDYCDLWLALKATLEDQGLIFAQGEREKLSTSHGKIYCSYLLLKRHLGEGILFSKYERPADIYKSSSSNKSNKAVESAPAPAPAPNPAPVPGESKKEESGKSEPQGKF